MQPSLCSLAHMCQVASPFGNLIHNFMWCYVTNWLHANIGRWRRAGNCHIDALWLDCNHGTLAWNFESFIAFHIIYNMNILHVVCWFFNLFSQIDDGITLCEKAVHLCEGALMKSKALLLLATGYSYKLADCKVRTEREQLERKAYSAYNGYVNLYSLWYLTVNASSLKTSLHWKCFCS